MLKLFLGQSLTTAGPETTVPPPTTSELPENCTFESGTCDWVADTTGQSIWTKQTGTSADGSHTGRGPSFDQTTGGDSECSYALFVV